MRCSWGSSSAWRELLALGFCCVLSTPLIAQSTPPEPSPSKTPISALSTLRQLSNELVQRLSERQVEVENLKNNLAQLNEALLQAESDQSASLSTLAALQTERQATLNSLDELQTALEASKKAQLDLEVLETQTISDLRRERDDAKWVWGFAGAGGMGLLWVLVGIFVR